MNLCPTCRKVFILNPGGESLPFCSERCRLLDLGEWLTEKRRINSDDPISVDTSNSDEYTKH